MARRGLNDQAERVLRHALEVGGPNRDTLVSLADVLSVRGAPADAARQVERALELDASDSGDLLLLLGRLRLQAGQVDRALEAFEQALRRRSSAETFVRTAMDLESSGHTDQAIRIFSQARERFPNDVVILRSLTHLLLREQRGEEAATVLRAAREKAETVSTLSEIASLFGELADPIEAEVALKEIVKIDPDNAAALDRLAATYESARRWDEALEMLDRLTGASGLSADRLDAVMRRRVRICLETGRLKSMIVSAEKDLGREAMALAETALEVAKALEGMGELSRAIEYYVRTLALGHPDADFVEGRIAELKRRLERGEI